MDDITFCLSDCQRTDCYRHPSNIQDRTIPHSYADFRETETCPFAKDINVTINDDTISRKATIDAVHTATYGFICGAEDGDEMTDADKLVLSINKAVCAAIKALPSVQPQRWIPCSDRMPEESEDIIVTYVDDEETRIIPVNYGDGTWYDCIFNTALDPIKVIAWMPLPESYKEGQDE